MNALKYGLRPYACIVDGKTLRVEAMDIVMLKNAFTHVVKVKNPPGMLCDGIINTVSATKEGTLILVEGEEDLCGLAVLLRAPKNHALIYGQPPRVGVVLIIVDDLRRKKAEELLRRFKEVLI